MKNKSAPVGSIGYGLKFGKEIFSGRRVVDAREFVAATYREEDLQRQIEEVCRLKQLFFIRIPDDIYRLKQIIPAILPIEAVNRQLHPWMIVTLKNIFKFVISNFFKGLPDIIILKPADRSIPGMNHALAIEAKVKKGKLSQGQERVGRILNVRVVRSIDEFVAAVEKWERTIQ